MLLLPFVAAGATLPPYFFEEPVGGEWNEACGLTFDPNGRMFVWERGGRVWIVETNGERNPQPLIDISEEVGGWRDFGMLGFALDPGFSSNGYIYLLYVVDRHHLKNFGTGTYNPGTDQYFEATIGRLTRYTARSADGFRSVDPASRRVLIGESISTGFPILYQSHGPGTLLFGTDGTLLVSAGEGASYDSTDAGGSSGGSYAPQGLSDGIITQEENVGAYRAQLLESLGGKILRIDPGTGEGVPGNPFFNPAAPRSARSRVWALGFRNPYRMTLRPNSGSPNRADARPGVLYVGDVGWSGWEELNIVRQPGQNFGWPVFEGMETQSEYDRARAFNRNAPNPLYGTGGCTQRYFSFHDLMHDDTLDPAPWFPNPCDSSQSLPPSVPHFVHSRAAIEWRNYARSSSYDGNGNATMFALEAPGSPVTGTQFGGECSVGGVWYEGNDFPASYRGTYFHADFETGWIRNFVFDGGNRLLSVQSFITNAGGVVAMATHPTQGGLYYVRWGTEVVKVHYSLGGNLRPTAVATANKTFGTSPLVVQFNGSGSFDPEGSPLSFQWDFGDGSPVSTERNPTHTFQAPAGVPTRVVVRLTVTDTNGAAGTATLDIGVNNSPPTVAIACPVNNTKYSMAGDTIYQLRALVADAEHADGLLSYRWQTTLHHNEHQHAEPVNTNHEPIIVISPLGCSGGESYHFRITLTVTDPGGLSATSEVRVYPDCDGTVAQETFPTPWMQRDIGAVAAAGNSIYENRVFTMEGSGDDIWGTADEFHFAYWAQPGNGQISARVASQENTQPGAKAGVMVRETLQPGARYAMAAVTPTGLLFQYRTSPGAASGFQLVYDLSAPYWVKLVRSGNSFSGYSSPDGISWSLMGSANVSMSNAVWGGLAVTSHNDGDLSTVLFDRVVGIAGQPVAANGPLPSPWLSSDVGLVALSGGATHTSGVFTVTGSGAGIGETVDAFRFVYRSWTGDVEIVTRLASLQDTAAWAAAGAMIRETLDPGAAGAMIGLTPRFGAGLQSRAIAGGGTVYSRGPGLVAPGWLRLIRTGNSVAGSVSSDGNSWSHVATHSLTMGSSIYVGLAVTSSDGTRLNRSVFSNVVVRLPQTPVNDGVPEPNWTVPRNVPHISWLPQGSTSQFALKIEDHPGHAVQVRRSVDMLQWEHVTQLENRGGIIFFVDAVGPNRPQQFYRVSVAP